jgi:drug/metabolite transporter (DMT)-like permease
MQRERRWVALAALTGGIIAISWSAIFVRWSRMPGVSSGFYRMLIAAPVLWAVLPLQRPGRHRISMRTFWITIAGGIFFAGDVGLWNVAVMHTSAGNATFLSNISPLFVGLFAWVLTRKPPSARFWTALLVSTAGSCLIVSADLHHALARSSADGLALLAAICFAMYLVITGRLRERHEPGLLLALSTTASAGTLFAVAMAGRFSLAVPGPGPLAALLALGLICQVAGYFGLTYALGHLPVTITSILWLTIAPFTAIFAWIIFGERMSVPEIAGGALVLTGVWIIGRRRKPEVPQMEELAAPAAEA